MIQGTCYFVSKHAADRYYKNTGSDQNADEAIAEGAISIGIPPTGPMDKLSIIPGEGRYQIESPDNVRFVEVAVPLSVEDEVALLSIKGGTIRLPKTNLSHYAEIKRRLEISGGKYNSKGYFSFADGINVDAVLSALLQGEVVNGKKDSQSFFTPKNLAIQVCGEVGGLAGKTFLEPSAGDGALADIAREAGADVVVVENHQPNIISLKKKGYAVIEEDFLSISPADIGMFDVICANPPFSRNQDIDHILHMVSFLKPNGCLSVIASQSWLKGNQKKHVSFRGFLEKHGAEITEIDAGAFNESGTNVGTTHIVLRLAA